MKKLLILTTILLFIFIFTGCNQPVGKAPDKKPTETEIQQSESSVVIPGNDNIPTNKFKSLPSAAIPTGTIPITVSPDGSKIFLMKVTGPDNKNKTLKGALNEKVELLWLDTAAGKTNSITSGIPFVSTVKWNKTGSMVAFCGGQRLTVFDVSRNKLSMNKDLGYDVVEYFGWSPDGTTIYTEHPHLINGTIYYLNESLTKHAYETKIDMYYKGEYRDSLYFATKRPEIDEEKAKQGLQDIDDIDTVVVDGNGKIIKSLPGARFRDSYGDAILQVDRKRFGLNYMPDINKPDVNYQLTDKYVYEAKFIENGYIIYTVTGVGSEVNSFSLVICNRAGKKVLEIPVSGPVVALSPDGKTGYVCGYNREVLEFTQLIENPKSEVKSYGTGVSLITQSEEESVLTALRGAMDIYYKFELAGQKDYEALEKYFINSTNPEQCALFEMSTIFNERNYKQTVDRYELFLSIKSLVIKGDRASAFVSGSGYNSFGSGMGIGSSVELIKKDGAWYVTGFSTYPDSKQYKEIRSKVEQYVKELKSGKLFEGRLKDKEISVGQIQFWQMSDPHLAENVEYSNYCKVYLKVSEDGKEVIYKMVLSKESSPKWKPIRLEKERLSFL